MSREWRQVTIEPYSQFYKVSNDGLVYSVRRGMELKGKLSKTGYLRVTLSKNMLQKTISIHKLVALAFVPNPSKKPTVNHINEIKTDNRAENLEWMTNAEQNTHGTRIDRAMANTDWKKRGEKIDYSEVARKHDYQRDDMCGRRTVEVYKDGSFYGKYRSQAEAAKDIGISVSRLSTCRRAGLKTERGYTFQ